MDGINSGVGAYNTDQARLDAQQDAMNAGTSIGDDGKAAAFEAHLDKAGSKEIAAGTELSNEFASEGTREAGLQEGNSVRTMDDIMNLVGQDEKSKLADIMGEGDVNNSASEDFLKELADKYGIPYETLLRLLQKAAEPEENANVPQMQDSPPGGSGPEAKGPSSTGGGKSQGGVGGGGAAGAEGSSDGANGSEGSGSADPKPEGEVHATSLDGKVKFYAQNKEDALKLKETFDNAYEKDDEFKKHVDGVVAEKGSMNVTAKDLESGIAGVAAIRGNHLAIDTNSTHRTHVLAHEILHNVGYEHGSRMDAATRQASDMK